MEPPSFIGHLIRVARGLDAGGYYNAAKLFWGLAFAEEIRASSAQGIPTDSAVLDREMDVALAVLAGRGLPPELLAALRRGQQGVRDNRTIARTETPPVFVCRACGEIALEQPPETCPTCGARALTFREIVPVFFLEPLPPQQALEALAAGPDAVAAAVLGLSDAQMAQPPRAGEWAVRDVLTHMLVAQGLLAGRVERLLTEDNPSLTAVAAWTAADDRTLSAHDLLERYRTARAATVQRLRGIAFQDWWRTGQHDEFGPVTLLQQASYFAKHERTHLPQIDAIRAALGA